MVLVATRTIIQKTGSQNHWLPDVLFRLVSRDTGVEVSAATASRGMRQYVWLGKCPLPVEICPLPFFKLLGFSDTEEVK